MKRLFFLRQDGWFEAELTGKLLQATDAELLRWAYGVTERNGYRNYLVTENPEQHYPPLALLRQSELREGDAGAGGGQP